VSPSDPSPKLLAPVHGIIFSALRDFLTAQHGPAVAKSVFGEEPEFLISQAYPDEALMELLARASDATGLDLDPLVGAFGAYTGEHVFPRLYPAFYSAARDARSFLLSVEERIHELVRATIPNAAPPRLLVKSSGADGVEILYDSPRRLCRLLEGLTVGTARFYGENAAIRETACMKRGAEACCFEVRLAPS
jgi:predicted hydrocarbon binding protein